MRPDPDAHPFGYVNAHTHLYSGLAPLGMPSLSERPPNFVQLLARIWWRLDRALDERTLRAAARFYVADALLHGTTTLVDHHESPNFIEGSLDVLAEACDELGIRAVLCFGATERNGGRAEASRGLAECERFHRENRRRLVKGIVGLHAPFTVSDESIREAGELCARLATPLHVHLAEAAVDLEDAAARRYPGPLARLAMLDALPRGSILAHGVHLSAEEVRQAEREGCWIVQNPRSNAGNGVGYPRALGVSRRVALGTDGFPSDLRAETRALLDEGRRHREHADTLLGRRDAGRRLIEDLFGGPLADRCEWDELGRVLRLTIAGRTVVRDRRLETADAEEVRRHAAEAAPLLWERMASL